VDAVETELMNVVTQRKRKKGDSIPFRKITKGKDVGKYKSQYGKIYTLKQLRAYYATKGWKRKVKKK